MRTSNILIVLNTIGLMLAILWWLNIPDYEPAITTLGLLGVLIGQIFFTQKRKKGSEKIIMNQKSGDNSTNYQAGGNMTVNNLKDDK